MAYKRMEKLKRKKLHPKDINHQDVERYDDIKRVSQKMENVEWKETDIAEWCGEYQWNYAKNNIDCIDREGFGGSNEGID